MNSKNFLLGLLIGGMTAAIGTLLSTPSSGKETRKAIKENTDVWINHLAEVKESLLELKKTLNIASIEGTETIKSFVSDLKTAITQWKKEMKPHQQELLKELASIEQSIQALESDMNNKKTNILAN